MSKLPPESAPEKEDDCRLGAVKGESSDDESLCDVSIKAPRHRGQRVSRNEHARAWTDDYHNLIDPDDDLRAAAVLAENAYADAVLSPTQAMVQTLTAEMRERVDESDQSVPVIYERFAYWARYQPGLEYSQHCRTLAAHKPICRQQVEIFLDENTVLLSDEAELGDWAVSPDHRYVIYTVDATGEEAYQLFVRHIASGCVWSFSDNAVGPELCWSRSSRYFFYTLLDDQGRTVDVVAHHMGSDFDTDVLIYREPDSHFEIGIERSRDEHWLVITTAGDDSSEVWLLDLVQHESHARLDPATARCVQTRIDGLEYYVEPQGQRLIILCNDYPGADGEFAVMTASIDQAERHNWSVLLEPQTGRHYEWVIAYKHFLLLHELVRDRQCYRVINESGDAVQPFALTAQRPTEQIEYVDDERLDATTVRFERSSLSQPERIEQYDLLTRVCTVLREDAPDDAYDRADYVEERINIENGDVSVPVSIVYRQSLRRAEGNPLLLYGYGAYETGVDTDFDVDRLSLLDRGVVYAIAHVRGGDEKGRAWYDGGRLQNKENSFTDFLAAAHGLIGHGYTRAGKIVIQGESAGGLLVAVTVNKAPELFAGVVAEVPFVDVVETMLNEDWPTTVQDYDEFGDPNDPSMFDVLMSYCPYQNIRQQSYPPMYVTSSVNDQRVPWWEALRWVARLRQEKTDDNAIVLKITENAGHQGLTGRTQELKQIAEVYAFILQCFDSQLEPTGGTRACVKAD